MPLTESKYPPLKISVSIDPTVSILSEACLVTLLFTLEAQSVTLNSIEGSHFQTLTLSTIMLAEAAAPISDVDIADAPRVSSNITCISWLKGPSLSATASPPTK